VLFILISCYRIEFYPLFRSTRMQEKAQFGRNSLKSSADTFNQREDG